MAVKDGEYENTLEYYNEALSVDPYQIIDFFIKKRTYKH